MKTLLITLISLSLTSMVTNASALNCEKAAKNTAKIMAEKFGPQSPFAQVAKDSKKLAKGVQRCEAESKTSEGKENWSCAEKAKTFEQLKACEK